MNNDKLIKAINKKYQYNMATGYFLRRKRYRESPAGSIACGLDIPSGYKNITVQVDKKNKLIRAHRAAFLITHGYLPEVVDHINGKKTDNRISNLRAATYQENSCNKKGEFTGRGVQPLSNGKFYATIRKHPLTYNLGTYDTEREAATAYNIAARQIHGEFATVNDITEVEGIKIKLRVVGDGVGKRVDRHDDIVKHVKKKTRLCQFTSNIYKRMPANIAKYTSRSRMWNQKTKHKQMFIDGRRFSSCGAHLTKEDVTHIHQYGFIPKKQSQTSATKSKSYNMNDANDRLRFRKEQLHNITYDQATGIFYRDGKEIKQKQCHQGYSRICLPNRSYLAHRLAYFIMTGEWPECVDHINNVRHDNRAANLRAATSRQNSMNRKSSKNSLSKYKGVTFRKDRCKWVATINRKRIGSFINEKDAAQAYNKAAKKQYGNFAYLNKI